MKKISLIIVSVYFLMYLCIFISMQIGLINLLFLKSSIYAGILNLINTAIALISFNYSIRKNNKIFLIGTLGVLVIRLLSLLMFVFLIIKFLNIDLYGFIFVFFVFYFVLLFIEVVYINKLVKLRNNITVTDEPNGNFK